MVILSRRKYNNVVSGHIKQTLNIITGWTEKVRINIYPSKSTNVAFTKRIKVEGLVLYNITASEEVQLSGILHIWGAYSTRDWTESKHVPNECHISYGDIRLQMGLKPNMYTMVVKIYKIPYV